ncbi:hypothetical protein OJAV_G00209750 [Oryzias javanicus]|uniref:Uncharacterized protein n=1 Tax=Oryzias javanicus TaxID=123683 RepID=A0A437C7P0_ORYJA|nr:hypothetical protein OJAV_G00209750 [Oryzias javanicus]
MQKMSMSMAKGTRSKNRAIPSAGSTDRARLAAIFSPSAPLCTSASKGHHSEMDHKNKSKNLRKDKQGRPLHRGNPLI